MAHWIRHASTAQVDGVRGHKVTVTFRKLLPEDERYETIYRALRNHYRLVKLYNVKLKKLNAQIEQICFLPPDGLRDLLEDETARELEKVWQRLPEFEDHIVEQILSTFMREALNEDGNDPLMRRRLDELGLETLDLSRGGEVYSSAHDLLSGGKTPICGEGLPEAVILYKGTGG